MYSVSQLAKLCGVSRTTVLYYEKKGLLQASSRTENGYRWYGEEKVILLKTILTYRSYGLPVSQLKGIIDHGDDAVREKILRKQFEALEYEISELRNQQKAIIKILQQPTLTEIPMVTKNRWVEIMRSAGLTEAHMVNWHRKFEAMEPEEHQKFLESLGIEQEEINKIRKL